MKHNPIREAKTQIYMTHQSTAEQIVPSFSSSADLDLPDLPESSLKGKKSTVTELSKTDEELIKALTSALELLGGSEREVLLASCNDQEKLAIHFCLSRLS